MDIELFSTQEKIAVDLVKDEKTEIEEFSERVEKVFFQEAGKNILEVQEKNIKDKKFNVVSKISFYPMGEEDYMEHIAKAVMTAKRQGSFLLKSSHYVSILEGDVHDVFGVLEEIFQYGEANLSHYYFTGYYFSK